MNPVFQYSSNSHKLFDFMTML